MKALVYRHKNALNDFGIRLEEVAEPPRWRGFANRALPQARTGFAIRS
jgi:hypothetical protein